MRKERQALWKNQGAAAVTNTDHNCSDPAMAPQRPPGALAMVTELRVRSWFSRYANSEGIFVSAFGISCVSFPRESIYIQKETWSYSHRCCVSFCSLPTRYYQLDQGGFPRPSQHSVA